MAGVWVKTGNPEAKREGGGVFFIEKSPEELADSIQHTGSDLLEIRRARTSNGIMNRTVPWNQWNEERTDVRAALLL